jgi:pimeloyl-ACP methyl ester carboxylesterase
MPRLKPGDVSLYYEIAGAGDPLLFIHGLGSSCRDWSSQLPVFARTHRTLAFDVRGHGRSDKPRGPYSVPLFAADTAALLRSLDIAPAHVVGLSMGGMIAFELAVDAPELVRSLVIVNSAPALILRGWKQRLGWFQRQSVVRLLGMRRMGEMLGGRLLPEPGQRAVRREFVARWAENDRRAYYAAMQALVGWTVADHLGRIRCPVLVVAADRDYTPVAFKQAYVDRLPHAALKVIPDSRHLTPIDQPEAFNQALAGFLTGLG